LHRTFNSPDDFPDLYLRWLTSKRISTCRTHDALNQTGFIQSANEVSYVIRRNFLALGYFLPEYRSFGIMYRKVHHDANCIMTGSGDMQ
jgi:hypothetical protein